MDEVVRSNGEGPSCVLGDPRKRCHPGMPSACELVWDSSSNTYFTGISTSKGHLHCIWRPPISVYPFQYFCVAGRNVITSQAAKNVRASQDALFAIFERLEAFFRRLEIYTEAALDQKMLDTVRKIMTEVLNIIGIATKEIKQGRISRSFLHKRVPR